MTQVGDTGFNYRVGDVLQPTYVCESTGVCVAPVCVLVLSVYTNHCVDDVSCTNIMPNLNIVFQQLVFGFHVQESSGVCVCV